MVTWNGPLGPHDNKHACAALHAQALARERERRRREGAPAEVLLGTEREIVQLMADWLQFELQSGHTEQALACLQAQAEFACFAPTFPGAVPALALSRGSGTPSQAAACMSGAL
jgi:hypothetical protein